MGLRRQITPRPTASTNLQRGLLPAPVAGALPPPTTLRVRTVRHSPIADGQSASRSVHRDCIPRRRRSESLIDYGQRNRRRDRRSWPHPSHGIPLARRRSRTPHRRPIEPGGSGEFSERRPSQNLATLRVCVRKTASNTLCRHASTFFLRFGWNQTISTLPMKRKTVCDAINSGPEAVEMASVLELPSPPKSAP